MALFTNKEYVLGIIKETREKLDRLEKQMKEEEKEDEKEDVGFEDDEIFLLSKEEYVRYKDKIPQIDCCWWLRSPGSDYCSAAYVYRDGSVSRIGYSVDDDAICVRPALKSNNLESLNLEIGETVRVLGLMAQYIGDNSFLLCKSIAMQRFDQRFEDKLHLYETSQVKQFIEEWLEKKKTEEQDG